MSRNFNLPPGCTIRDIDPPDSQSLEDFLDEQDDRAYERHVDDLMLAGQNGEVLMTRAPNP